VIHILAHCVLNLVVTTFTEDNNSTLCNNLEHLFSHGSALTQIRLGGK